MSMKRPVSKLRNAPATPRNSRGFDDEAQREVHYQHLSEPCANMHSMGRRSVIGYVRVSTQMQAQEGVSLDAQRRKIRAYCELYELDLVDICADEGASGASLQRPGLQRALSALQCGSATGIVISRLDRLTRSVRDLSELLTGVFSSADMISVSDNIDTRTPTGRLILHVLTSVAQWEREVGAARTSEGIRQVAETCGGWIWGQAPYGYEYGPRDNEGRLMLQPVEAEQETIGRIRELVAQQVPQRKIAEMLTSEGRCPKDGGAWHQSQVAKVMQREGIKSLRQGRGKGRKPTTGKGVRPLARWRYPRPTG